MGKDLRQFLQAARAAGPEFYVESKKPLKPKLEPFILQQKLLKEGRYPVIYCPEIEGSRIPLVTGLVGSYELLGLAMGMDPRKMDKFEISREFTSRKMTAGTRPVKQIPAAQAPVREVILKGNDVDLNLLPITQHHERDSGRYVAAGFLICKNPDTGVPNAGIYRHEVKGKDIIGCDLAPAHNAAFIAGRYAALGKPMEVAIVIGHHPAVVLACGSEGPVGMNELEVAGGLLGEQLEVVDAETVDLQVPARAEIVIEGVIDRPIDGTGTDGPFGEYTWYYGEVAPCFLMRVTAITMRRDAIYHDLDPAHPEHNLAGALGWEASAFEAVKKVLPGVKAVHVPISGVSYHVYVSIKKRVPGEGKIAGIAAIAGHPRTTMVVVVDEDVDVFNEREVMWAIATRTVADRDVSIISNTTGQRLNPSAHDETRLKRGYMVSKMIIDATMPVDLPFSTRITPNKELWQSMRLEDYLKK
ncbi:MAG: UbiD family decarboxylase [Betaproteobacteria bacterium]|nr:UbiD family decarboxylase [Betaproteobacteria bacterium]